MNTSILLAYTLKEKTFHIKHIPTNSVANNYQKLLNIQFLKGGIYEI